MIRVNGLFLRRSIFSLILVLAVICGLFSFRMVSVSRAIPSPQNFSAERAFKHVEAISLNPHPIGSDEIVQVRNYIIDEISQLGFNAEIQETTVPDYFGINNNEPVIIKNIFAIIPGTNPNGSMVLAGHYDTVPASPGANDDSSAVATLLETARALSSDAPLQNDIVLLFTDAEEPGQYRFGARFFVENYQSINDVCLILNFEALGKTGPSIMFEAGPGNSWLIEAFARGSRNPVAFSFMSDLYRLIAKGGTDFSAFEEAGINGLNFAYSFERTGYHTALDNIEVLDKRSLQHHGDYALGLTRYFGNIDIRQASSNKNGDSIYHSLLGLIVLRYSAAWALPLALIAGALLICLIIVALRRRLITVFDISLSTTVFFMEIIVVTFVLSFGWWGLDSIHLAFGTVVDPTVKAHLLFAAFLFLTIVMMVARRTWIFKRWNYLSLSLGPIVFLWIIALLASLYLPGFSIIIAFPLLFSLLPLGWVMFGKSDYRNSWVYFTLVSLSVIVSVVLMTAPIYLLFQAIGTASPGFSGSPAFPIIGLSIFFWVVLLGLLLPHLWLLEDWKNRKVVYGLLIIAVVFLIIGSVLPGTDIHSFGLSG